MQDLFKQLGLNPQLKLASSATGGFLEMLLKDKIKKEHVDITDPEDANVILRIHYKK